MGVRDRDLVLASFQTMTDLFKFVGNQEAAAGCCNPATGALIAAIAQHISDTEIVEKGFLAIRQGCVKFEWLKDTFDESGLVELLVTALKAHPENAAVCKSVCAD